MALKLQKSKSITHDHILAVLNTEFFKRFSSSDRPIRILEAGCGKGDLLAFLAAGMAVFHPDLHFEIYGMDVHDYGTRGEESLSETLGNLKAHQPQLPWELRVIMISVQDPWPFQDEFFDVVISNQVMEHVENPGIFIGEARRVLRPGGFSAHLFPLKHCIWEDHVKLPMAHRITNQDMLEAAIYILSALGIGKYRKGRKKNGINLIAYSRKYADYLINCTHYLTQHEAMKIGKANHLRTSFRYSPGFYSAKARSVLGLAPRHRYRSSRLRWLDGLSVYFLRYISSVTLFFEKGENASAASGNENAREHLAGLSSTGRSMARKD